MRVQALRMVAFVPTPEAIQNPLELDAGMRGADAVHEWAFAPLILRVELTPSLSHPVAATHVQGGMTHQCHVEGACEEQIGLACPCLGDGVVAVGPPALDELGTGPSRHVNESVQKGGGGTAAVHRHVR